MKYRILTASSALLIAASVAQAQDNDFRLFEEVQTSNSSGSERRVTPQNNDSSANNPEFVLLGTARIGSHYSAILEHRSGNTVRFQVDPNSNTRIPGYSDFSVVDVGPGQISLHFPEGTPCLENSSKGITCSSVSNIARLSLVIGEPVVRAKPEREASDVSGADSQQDDGRPTNPFAALQQAAANNNDNPAQAEDRPQPRTFQVRRIAPEDVPEGYRVISTPFGDRLVEE